jgi:hypothetical protein
MTEADFVSKEIILDILISQAYRQLREGLRYCGSESGGVLFITQHGIPECLPAEEDGSVLCDLYTPGIYGGRSNFIWGRIELKPHGEGTIAILRVTKATLSGQEESIEAWEQFLRGNAKEVCP